MITPIVDDAEVLYRQIKPGCNPLFYDPAKNPPVHPSLFRPTRADVDGLSMIRSLFRSDIWSAHRPNQPAVRYQLARLQAEALRRIATDKGFPVLGFTSNSDDFDVQHGEPWAHCVVNEINHNDYATLGPSKARIREWAERVAESLATHDVIGPFATPTSADSYRP